MERWLALAIAGTVIGCGKDKDDSQTAACSTELVATIPAAGSSDGYYRAAIEASFDDVVDMAMIDLYDASGAAVAGTEARSDDGKTAYFTPLAPLVPGASYTAEVMWCGDTRTIDFTMSALGDPIDEPAAIEGRTYLVGLREARFAEPSGVGPLLATQIDQDILLMVTAVDATSLTMIGALTLENDSGQDFCLPTIDFPQPADFTDAPYWEVQADNATLNVADNEVAIENLVISGTFSSDGTTFGGGVLGGTIDTSLLGGLVGSDDPDYICELAAGFGDECSECPDGTAYCLGLLLDQLQATSVGTVPIRTISQPDCDAECPASKANPKCEKYYVPPK
jgi:hypothetical protein